MDNKPFKAGFVSILGKPNAGKSTLLNCILKEKLAIVSPKVQTTRHRILGFLNEENYQIVFSDTPGIIEPEYLMHTRMMSAVSASVKDADVIIFLVDAKDDMQEALAMFDALKLKVPTIVAINKIDIHTKIDRDAITTLFTDKKNVSQIVFISALADSGVKKLVHALVKAMPVHAPYYDTDDLSDRPLRFFVAEMIREPLFELLENELPYHSAVLVEAFEEKTTLTKIVASIIVTRETQKAIVIGKDGAMIKKIGSKARVSIEKFLDRKVFLELHVKVRDDWRKKDIYLNEYGY